MSSPSTNLRAGERRATGCEQRATSDERPVMSSERRATSDERRVLWYVIQTKPLSEGNVETHLKNADFETFLPKIKTMIRGRKRPSSRIKSLFPSYLFARIDLSDANLYRMIKYTRGVRKILGDGTFPVPVPDEMINIIRERMGDGGVIEQRITMKKGDCVRIRGGVFRDLVGILEKPVSAAGRVRVLLSIMNKLVKCEMSAADVERVE